MAKAALDIHIGTHKTGSTAIQHTLRNSRPALRQEGIVYIAAPQASAALMTCQGASPEIMEQIRNDLNRKAMDEPQNGGGSLRFLMSFEGFSGNPGAGYRNAALVANHLRRATEDFSVRIIVYLRRQDDFTESLYTQDVQEGGSCSFESFVSGLPPNSFDWEFLLSSYARAFGGENMLVRRYDKSIFSKPPDLVRDFFRTIGISDGIVADDAVPCPNRGYSRGALELARLANPYLDATEKGRLRRLLQRTSSRQPFEVFSLWDCRARNEFMSRYEESNSRVARLYFGGSLDPLFPFSIAEYEMADYEGLSLEVVVPVLVKAILAQQEIHEGPLPIAPQSKTDRWLKGLFRIYRSLRSMVRRGSLPARASAS